MLKKFFKYLFLFLFGGAAYISIEILYRGYSHWLMFIIGGLAFLMVGMLNEVFKWETPIEIQSIIGGGIITGIEFVTGLIANIQFNMGIWDYSNLPLNVMGQICLPFTFIWILLSAVIIVIDDWLRYKLFDEEKPHYTFLWRRKK